MILPSSSPIDLVYENNSKDPPREWFDLDDLTQWCDRHNLLAALEENVHVLAPFLTKPLLFESSSALPTVVEVYRWATSSTSGLEPTQRYAVAESVRNYLAWRANRRSILGGQRAGTWTRPLEHPRLERARTRAYGALEAIQRKIVRNRPKSYRKARLFMGEEQPELRLRFYESDPVDSPGDILEGDAALSLMENDGDFDLLTSCNCAHHNTFGFCDHEQMALELALDFLCNPENEHHDDWCALIERPLWQRRVDAWLDAAAHVSRTPDEEPEQLVWRLYFEKRRLVLEPALRRRSRKGSWTRGRKITFEQAVTAARSSGREEDTLALLLPGAAEQYNPEAKRTEVGPSETLLDALMNHPRLYDGINNTKLEFQRGRLSLQFSWDRQQLRPRVLIDDVPVSRSRDDVALLGNSGIARRRASSPVITTVRVPPKWFALVADCLGTKMHIPAEGSAALVNIIERLQNDVAVDLPEELEGACTQASTRPHLRLNPTDEMALDVSFWVRPFGDEACWQPGQGPVRPLRSLEGLVTCAQRDFQKEKRRADAMAEALGLNGLQPKDDNHWRLTDPHVCLELVAKARQLGDELPVEWPKDAAWRVYRAHPQDLKVRVEDRSDWFGLSGGVEVDGQTVPLRDLLLAVRRGQTFVRLAQGRFAIIEKELEKRLADIAPVVFGEGRGDISVSRTAIPRVEEALMDANLLERSEHWSRMLDRMKASIGFEPELPKGLRADLRPYQREGVFGLARLASWSQGACLADEMGLGKTLQALTFLLNRATLGPAIVIAPTSVVSGWFVEAERFVSGLNMRLYREAGREALLDSLGPRDVIVTSYDIAANDVDLLSSHRFATCIIDEAQAVKNASTRRAKAVRAIRADFKLALSGTVLENHLGELWSIFNIITPGLLGPWSHFAQTFAIPIEKHGLRERMEVLADLVRPFLLRRSKREVAPELPPRTEMTKVLELSVEERALYDDQRARIISDLAASKTGQSGGHRIDILAALTKLRRLACHPRLVFPDCGLDSTKLTRAVQIIEDLSVSGERALVFSQFTSYLALLKSALDARGIGYLYLDGSTLPKDRGALVEAWGAQKSDLFLISLRAGGTGLNLPGADYVLHLDPWWNPAVEDQATDRTHRIGQTKPVNVVRLVAQNTIEEAVIALHDRKRDLADGILSGASDTAARLSNEELIELVKNNGLG